MAKLNWEWIADGSTWRLKIYGGWLVHKSSSCENEESTAYSQSESMCFVPDPEHKWII